MEDGTLLEQFFRFGIAGAILVAWILDNRSKQAAINRMASTLDKYVQMMVDMTNTSTKAITEVHAYLRGRNGRPNGGGAR